MLKLLAGAVGLGLLLYLFVIAWPVSPLLLAAGLTMFVLRADSRKDKVWSKALQSTLKPVLIALSILTVCVLLFRWLDPGTGEALLNAEDRFALALYKVMKPLDPSWWVYLGILALATWISWRHEESRTLSRVKTTKQWYGQSFGVVTMLASFTLVGNATVLSPRMDGIQSHLRVKYQNAKDRKECAARKYLAESTMSTALISMPQNKRADFKNFFQAVAHAKGSAHYKARVVDQYAGEQTATLKTVAFAEPVSPDSADPPDEVMKSSPDIDSMVAAVEQEQRSAAQTELMETEAGEGLKKMISVLAGEGNGSALEAVTQYVNVLVDAYASEYAVVLKPLLNQWMKPVAKSMANDYADQAVSYFAGQCHWAGLPRGSEALISLQLHNDMVSLAEKTLQDAQQRAVKISSMAYSAQNPEEASRARHSADTLQSDVEEASHVVGGSGEHAVVADTFTTGAGAATASAVAAHEAMVAAEKATAAAAERAVVSGAEKGIVESLLKVAVHAL